MNFVEGGNCTHYVRSWIGDGKLRTFGAQRSGVGSETPALNEGVSLASYDLEPVPGSFPLQ